MPGYANPQNLNRYSYVTNNPLRYIDPSGHKPACGEYGEDCSEDELDALTGGGNSGGIDLEDMETSDEGEDFIIYWENAGGPPNAYPYEDEGGTCTIGYGHVLFNPDGKGCSGALRKYYRLHPLSPSGALELLTIDIAAAERVINDTIAADLSQAQFDALVSYIFNSGGGKFREKGIPGLINSGNYQEAAKRMESGPNTTGDPPEKLDILVDRRLAEANLFLFGIYVP